MQVELNFTDYHSGKSPEILRAVKFAAGLERLLESKEVTHLEIDIYLRYPSCPMHMLSLFKRFEGDLESSKFPKIKYIKTSKKLKLEYLSSVLVASNDGFRTLCQRNLQRSDPETQNSMLKFAELAHESPKLEFQEEFSQLLIELGMVLKSLEGKLLKKTGLDFQPVIEEIEKRAKKLPTSLVEVWDLIHEAQRWECNRTRVEVARPPYHRAPLPEKIRVDRMEPASLFIGKLKKGNQFWARIALAASNSLTVWYVVLHLFAPDGAHLTTKAKRIGTSKDDKEILLVKAQFELDDLVSGLDVRELGPIEFKMFEFQFEDTEFGTTDCSTEEFGDCIRLLPGDIFFSPPWNGSYDFGMWEV